jgi:endonuclease/exonuclease/phosphatase family metal-dependent hydrolase
VRDAASRGDGRVARLADATATGLILVALGATVTAQIVRDRTLALALLMCLPIWPLAVLAVLRDVLARGRALPLRWLLLVLGLASGAFSIWLLWCPARAPEVNPASAHVTLAQWNVQWGAARGRESLTELLAKLEAYHPDVICLSEAPRGDRLQRALRASSWHVASVENSRPSAYWFRLTVLSREPVALRREWELPTGHAALFEIDLRPRALHLLMVDLQSDPLLPRSPTLVEVAHLIDELAAGGVPVDVVAGDFNTPGRFLGFDALAAAASGYRRAALWSGQWRATWPDGFPLSPLDIDHIWVRHGLDVASAQLFSNPNSDHRGQLTVLGIH